MVEELESWTFVSKYLARASALLCRHNHETSWKLRTLIPSSWKLGVPDEVEDNGKRVWLLEKQGILELPEGNEPRG
jgi:hypothetical protein